MQYKILGLKWLFKVGAPRQLSLTVDKNAARIPQLFILQERSGTLASPSSGYSALPRELRCTSVRCHPWRSDAFGVGVQRVDILCLAAFFDYLGSIGKGEIF